MAFLDNSGDIILDAVLTDTGRFRMAKGDGSFKIAKFALGDDEIDYSNFKNDNADGGAHVSGSAYYDLEILQTPILEAFTNNTSLMKTKLITIPRTNLLFLPAMRLNTTEADSRFWNNSTNGTTNYFVVTCNKTTTECFVDASVNDGWLDGFTLAGSNHVRIDQGLITTEIAPETPLDLDLKETQYIIEMDNRLGRLASASGRNLPKPSFIDDDNVATYFVSTADGAFVSKLQTSDKYQGPITGPRGTRLEFKIQASTDMQFTSTVLFSRFGGSVTNFVDAISIDFIDSTVRVTGATTGYRIDVPIRFVKKQ
tara:strand:+ start:8872 stop:9807 length:936 start_codon:yes stop_codon:yes gene_type:complete